MKSLVSVGVGNSSGNLGLHVYRPRTLKDIIALGLPHKGLPQEVKDWRKDNLTNHLWKGFKDVFLAKALNIPTRYGALYLTKQTPIIPDSLKSELLEEYVAQMVPGISFPYWASQKGFRHESLFLGLAGFRVVTDVGVGYIVDAWQNSVELENMKYHGLGTGSTAEAAGDTALVTELTTEYTGNVRATGSTTEGASANIFRTLGTNTLDGTPGAALREHGIFSASTVGVLLDRTVFAAITLSSGDSLASTYDHTQVAGS
jgi:hypothetical protein